MAGLLTGPLCGWPRDRLLLMENEPSPGDLPDRLITAFDGISDVALFYFVGHGQIAPDDQLCLGLVQSRMAGPESAGRDQPAVLRCPPSAARQRGCGQDRDPGLLLAGLATSGVLGGLAGEVLDLTGTGAYTMAATSAYATAWYQDGPRLARPQTYFTKYLADLVEEGIPGQPYQVQLDPLFKQLRENLAADQRPVPRSRAVNDAREFAFAYNAAPPEAQRDPDREIKDLTRRVAEAQAHRIEAEAARARDLAEAEARERALRADGGTQPRAGTPPRPNARQARHWRTSSRVSFRTPSRPPNSAWMRPPLPTRLPERPRRPVHVTAKPETVPAAHPAPPSDAPPPATESHAEIATSAPAILPHRSWRRHPRGRRCTTFTPDPSPCRCATSNCRPCEVAPPQAERKAWAAAAKLPESPKSDRRHPQARGGNHSPPPSFATLGPGH